MGEGIRCGKLKERDNLEYLGARLSIILKWILKKDDFRFAVD